MLLGGNVLVERGGNRGGSFKRIPACRTRKRTGCVVAYSVFDETPPADAFFGRPGGALTDLFGLDGRTDLEVLCTNPAALGGGPAPLSTLVPTSPLPRHDRPRDRRHLQRRTAHRANPWVQPQDHYTGACDRSSGANVLRIAPVGAARDLEPVPDPTWGLHLTDVNIALGNLVDLAGAQGRSFLRAKARRKAKQRAPPPLGPGRGGRPPPRWRVGPSPPPLFAGSGRAVVVGSSGRRRPRRSPRASGRRRRPCRGRRRWRRGRRSGRGPGRASSRTSRRRCAALGPSPRSRPSPSSPTAGARRSRARPPSGPRRVSQPRKMSLAACISRWPSTTRWPVVAEAAAPGVRLEHRGLGLLDLQEQRVVVVAAEHQGDPGARADAAHPHHLARQVDEAVALEQGRRSRSRVAGTRSGGRGTESANFRPRRRAPARRSARSAADRR